MMNWVDAVMLLGARYGVNPVIFAAIYIGAIPFFLLCSGAAVRRMRRGQPAVLPILGAGLCFCSAYLYLALAGHDIPWWVWVLVGVLIAYGVWSAVHNFRQKLGKPGRQLDGPGRRLDRPGL